MHAACVQSAPAPAPTTINSYDREPWVNNPPMNATHPITKYCNTMKSHRRSRISAAAATASVAIICVVGGGGGVVSAEPMAAASSSSSSSSSIRGVGGSSGRVMRNIVAAASASSSSSQYISPNNTNNNNSSSRQREKLRHSIEHPRRTLQHDERVGLHRKSDNGDDDGVDQQQQKEEEQQPSQYSWNVNPDKLQAMLAATTDSDRQDDEVEDPLQEHQAVNTNNIDDDDDDDDAGGVNDDGEEGEDAAFMSHHRDEGGDDDDDGNSNMVSMSSGFAYGDDQPEAAAADDDEGNSNGIGIPGLSVYSLAEEETSPSDTTTTTTTPLMPEEMTAAAPLLYFPIWPNDNIQGCTSYATPPEKYLEQNDEIQYLFDTKLDCCYAWFQKLEEYEACLDEEITLADYPVVMKELGMEYEVVEEERDDDDDDTAVVAAVDDDDMITLANTGSSAGDSAPSPQQSQPLPTHEQGYYPANYAGAGDSAPAPSPISQPLSTHEQGYYPADYEGDGAPAPSPISQPLSTHEQGYHPANYGGGDDDDAPTAPSPQSQPLPTHEQEYYPSNYDPDAPPPPSSASDSVTDTTATEGGEAISGDSVISDLVLEAMLTDDTIMPALNLQSSPENGHWEIIKHDDDYDGGKFVLSANTRKVILGMPANSHGVTTYQGQATMSVTITAGPAGGVLTFGTYSNARAPIEVLQIMVDGLPMIAVTSPSSEWVEQTLDIPQGTHVVTFEHISNPENLSMKELEGLGKPGSSMVDGLTYVDNVGEPLEEFTSSAITVGPTSSPWSESDDETTVDNQEASSTNVSSTTSLPMQNYCGKTLALIQETCYTADAPPTCNEDDGPCPEGMFCWGNVECHVPEGEVAGGVSVTSTPPPTNPPLNVTSAPTSSPTGLSSHSFLDSFIFGTDEGSQGTVLEDDAQEQPKQASGCLEGFPPVQGHPGCCVPEPTFLGDGACDAHAPYNTVECGYDLGDCCRESCDTNAQFGCKAMEGDAYGPFGFYCIDPQYSTVEEDCTNENREWIGDGGCDEEFNTQACGWDGGDCCVETCDTEFAYYECGGEQQPFNCLDPNIIHQFDYSTGKI
jgi:hypothetical protein